MIQRMIAAGLCGVFGLVLAPACDGLGLGGGGAGGACEAGGGGSGGADECFGKPATKYIDCRKLGLSASACSDACLDAGVSCVALANHPYKSGLEPGKLTACKNGAPTSTCTYTFTNGDGCVLIQPGLKWLCEYAGGK